MDGQATRGSPLGCFTGVLATIPLGFAIAGGYGLWKLQRKLSRGTAPEKLEGLSEPLWAAVIIGSTLFILLSWLSLRILRTTNWKTYDPANDTSLHH